MGHKLIRPCLASELASYLKLSWDGLDVEITHVKSLGNIEDGALCFSKVKLLEGLVNAAAVIAPAGSNCGGGALIHSLNPRFAFAKALIAIDQNIGFDAPTEPPQLGEGVIVSSSAVLGRGVVVGARSVIGHHVVISDGVVIGEDCVIKSNSVIGEAGFGFERDDSGVPVRMLHLGNVTIGDRVEIGSLNTVCRATLGNTIIEDDVKTDDHVHIAHNCRVRRGALLTACVELSGGVEVGEFAWIGPNSSIIQKVVLGANAFVGIGSNVTKSVPNGVTVVGNPARIFRAVDK